MLRSFLSPCFSLPSSVTSFEESFTDDGQKVVTSRRRGSDEISVHEADLLAAASEARRRQGRGRALGDEQLEERTRADVRAMAGRRGRKGRRETSRPSQRKKRFAQSAHAEGQDNLGEGRRNGTGDNVQRQGNILKVDKTGGREMKHRQERGRVSMPGDEDTPVDHYVQGEDYASRRNGEDRQTDRRGEAVRETRE